MKTGRYKLIRYWKGIGRAVGAMIKLSEKLLHLGLALLVAGIVLRMSGYHQERGFLQDILFLETGLTPRGFLMASVAIGVFAIACGTVGIGKLLEKNAKESSKSD